MSFRQLCYLPLPAIIGTRRSSSRHHLAINSIESRREISGPDHGHDSPTNSIIKKLADSAICRNIQLINHKIALGYTPHIYSEYGNRWHRLFILQKS